MSSALAAATAAAAARASATGGDAAAAEPADGGDDTADWGTARRERWLRDLRQCRLVFLPPALQIFRPAGAVVAAAAAAATATTATAAPFDAAPFFGSVGFQVAALVALSLLDARM